jgi:endo-1,4-beta-xylanase
MLEITPKDGPLGRKFPTWVALAALLGLPVLAAAQAAPDTLRKLAQSRGLYVGAAVTFPGGNNVANRPEYERVLGSSFNGVVAENAMKFQSLSNARGTYNFTNADAIVAFADSNNMVVRGHTLVWHSQSATWFNQLTGDAASRDTTLKIMKHHIDTLAGRYKGRIQEWDVVNEAIAQNGGTSPNYRTENASRWHNRVGGPEYMDSAFVWAQRVDTNALLFYNDFGGEFMNNKSQNVYDLMVRFKDLGIPIHGVGLQCHFNNGTLDTAAMGQNMRRLAALGLTISLTEIDIQIGNSGTPTTQQLETQKQNYKRITSLCLSIPACRSLYAWGVNDNQSWRTPTASTAPLLFTGTSTITPKPSYWGVVEALQEATTLPTSAPSAPWNVIARRTGTSSSATVTWMAPVTDGRSAITGYKVNAWGDTTKTCTTTGALNCTVSGLHADSTYRFVVRAINAVGASGMSPPSTAGTGTVSITAKSVDRATGRFTGAYSFRLPDEAVRSTESMNMIVSDVSGRIVWNKTVHPARTAAREISWDGTTAGVRAPVGAYFVRIRTTSGGAVQEFVQKSVQVPRL